MGVGERGMTRMTRWKYAEIFSQEFPNGIRVSVSKLGFTVWDSQRDQWVIDGSMMGENREFTAAAFQKRDVKKLKALYEKYRFKIRRKRRNKP